MFSVATAIILFAMCMHFNCRTYLTKQQLVLANNNLQAETEKVLELNTKIESLNVTIADIKSDEYELIYIGNYKISHYCTETYSHICGEGAGITATGTTVTPGRTIAVDSSYIPYGSTVYIEGYGWRVAEDTGGAIKGKHIDMAVDTHSNAMSMGVNSAGVWILVKHA